MADWMISRQNPAKISFHSILQKGHGNILGDIPANKAVFQFAPRQ
jgi:hypothetical protein